MTAECLLIPNESMIYDYMLSPEEFYARFIETFNTQAEDPDSEIGLYYRSYGDQDKVSDAWTHSIGVFLARLANTFGLYQYSKIIDFKWYSQARPRGPPVVAIEHENDPKTVKREVKKLLAPRGKERGVGTRSQLKVLITYIGHRKSEASVSSDELLAGLKESIGEKAFEVTSDFQGRKGDFLLIVGDGRERPVCWHGFVLNWHDLEWSSIQVDCQKGPPNDHGKGNPPSQGKMD